MDAVFSFLEGLKLARKQSHLNLTLFPHPSSGTLVIRDVGSKLHNSAIQRHLRSETQPRPWELTPRVKKCCAGSQR